LLGSFQHFALTIIVARGEIRQVEREFGGGYRTASGIKCQNRERR